MALVEVSLTYRPTGTGESAPVSIATTSDPIVLRTVRDRVLREATDEADRWRSIDAGVFALRAAEAERLARVLDSIMPSGPHLSLVNEDDA